MAFTVSDAAAACGGKFYGPEAEAARAWRCDSREVRGGDGFAAIRGAKTDGHLYIKQAAEQGSRVVLAEREGLEGAGIRPEDFPGVSFIVTERRTEEALALAASEYLRRVAPKTIAITGSVGKTTTRELTAAALAQRYKVHSAVRSFNTIIGCALTVLSMAEETEALVLELGTNHFGEIAEMVKYFPPETVIITEVAPAHLEGFGSVEGVLRAKLEICGSAKLKKIIFNCDNALLREMLATNVADSFNRITIDGDMSTNDTTIVMANGRSEVELKAGTPEAEEFRLALLEVMQRLAREMVMDGEGATKFIHVEIEHARSVADAKLCAEAVANSLLCKTAWFGGDPNWGRVVAALGYSGAKFDPEKTDIYYDNMPVVRNGGDAGTPESALCDIVKQREFTVRVNLHDGDDNYWVWTSDVSYEYVKINADYHT